MTPEADHIHVCTHVYVASAYILHTYISTHTCIRMCTPLCPIPPGNKLHLLMALVGTGREQTGPTFVVDTHAAEPAGVPGCGQSAAATPYTGKHHLSLEACAGPGRRAVEGLSSGGKGQVSSFAYARGPWDSCGPSPRLGWLWCSCCLTRLRLCCWPGA